MAALDDVTTAAAGRAAQDFRYTFNIFNTTSCCSAIPSWEHSIAALKAPLSSLTIQSLLVNACTKMLASSLSFFFRWQLEGVASVLLQKQYGVSVLLVISTEMSMLSLGPGAVQDLTTAVTI